MQPDNDNFCGEQDFLLSKAKEMLTQCHELNASARCALATGLCPFLNNTIHSLQIILKQKDDARL